MIFGRGRRTERTIVVLGMHRSGTSVVAELIGALGVYLGDTLLGPNQDNPTGHHEPIELIELNDRILAAAGGSWSSPPSRQAVLTAGRSFREEVASWVKARNRSNPVWGWKDPRTVLTFDLFRPLLRRPRLVVVRRQCDAVALSLQKRDGTDYAANVALCEAYNRRIDNILKGRVPRLELHYERVRADPKHSLIELARFVGKTPSEPELIRLSRLVLDARSLESAREALGASGEYGD